MISLTEKNRIFKSIYMIGFFFASATALSAYINSEFLAGFIGTKTVGIIFSIASLVSIITFAFIGKWLKKYGNYKIAKILSTSFVLSLMGLILFKNPIIITILFITFEASATMLVFSMDVFLESLSKTNDTGTIRGTYLSIANSAWIIAPIIAGFIVADGKYWKIYLASIIIFLPVISIIYGSMSRFKDTAYQHISFLGVISEIPRHKNTYKILASNFILQFFYAWMVIYTPIYLRTYIGFDWQVIGIIFTIMLFPFAILEAPLGRLADERWGEKEMLTAGFIIIGVSTICLAFIPGADFWLWSAGLLTTRIGASMVEIMNETYFFKKNPEDRPDVVSLFRMTRPLAYIIAPIIATTLLQFIDYKMLFVILGFIMFLGMKYSLTLKDTL